MRARSRFLEQRARALVPEIDETASPESVSVTVHVKAVPSTVKVIVYSTSSETSSVIVATVTYLIEPLLLTVTKLSAALLVVYQRRHVKP